MNNKTKNNILILILWLTIFLTACTGEQDPSYDAGRYILSEVLLDGEALSPSSLYPEGAYLLLSSDGTGRLILGSDASDITWQQENTSFSVAINTLTAYGTREGDSLSLSLDTLHLELLFTEGDITSALTESASASTLSSQTRQQLIWSGDWSGRLWFEDPKGEWADYRDRTLTVTCSVCVQPDGTGILRLYSPYYSDSVPMASASFSLEEYSSLSFGLYDVLSDPRMGHGYLSYLRKTHRYRRYRHLPSGCLRIRSLLQCRNTG